MLLLLLLLPVLGPATAPPVWIAELVVFELLAPVGEEDEPAPSRFSADEPLPLPLAVLDLRATTPSKPVFGGGLGGELDGFCGFWRIDGG